LIRLDSRPSSCSTAITIVAAGLLGLGVVMVYSAGASLTSSALTDHPIRHPSFRQAVFSSLALVVLLVVGLVPYRWLRIRSGSWWQPNLFMLAATIVLLALVLVPGIGEVRNGARRWIAVGPPDSALSFQPSELAKLTMILFFAGYLAWIGDRIRRFWTGLLPSVFVIVVVCGLVGIEDFGTAALLLAVGGCMVLAAGARWWHLGLLALPGVYGAVHLVVSRPYRVQRLMTFLDPFADPQGSGYHQIQSLVTIASGSWWGRGLGAGIQKYGYLPEGRTDFIFAVICEELGILGGLGVIGLFAVLIWQGRRAMLSAPDGFGRLIALGATLMLGFQAAMNIAVVTVSVPTKGIGLPFISAGGTGVVLFSIVIGLLVNVARHHRPAPGFARHTASSSRDGAFFGARGPAIVVPPRA